GDKSREFFAGIGRAHNERRQAGRIRLAFCIRLEQLYGFMHYFSVGGDEAETAAMLYVEESKIKGKYIQLAAVDDHHLAVVANQVVGGARHGNACRQESHLELPEILL